MPTQEDKLAFSQRLKQALKRSPKKIETATELALNFNLRHPHASITAQAAQKWLSGQALPTADKIATLAEWLNVSFEWLRFGATAPTVRNTQGSKKGKPVPVAPPTESELLLIEKIRNMPEHRQNLVIDIVEQFSIDQAMWHK
ncbi:transcriptional regulator [Undibacterium sp. Ji42W]|uniref:transcriptional regulator n=1 Tax=Undibacterium sp. Ji42W TaxID=3413039 RepID=UPI003BF1119E